MTRFGFVSTYPPTHCGLATFTEALAASMLEDRQSNASIVRVLDAATPAPLASAGARSNVACDLIKGDQSSMSRAVSTLNACDVAIIQHEYGIYGGPDGDEILALMAGLRIPIIVVLHTVLPSPTSHQRQVLEKVCALASLVVVMTESAHNVLRAGYAVSFEKVRIIPHGVTLEGNAVARGESRHRRVLTWGLIGPGKGLEWGIRAMAELRDLSPRVEYTIIGQTHPKVLASEGDIYRNGLSDLIADLRLSGSVSLDARYLDTPRLAATVASSDVVLLPYDSRVQTTSGVLVEAIAAGIPVVATAFPHAVELLSTGAGLVVAHEDPAAIASALRTILTDPEVAARMSAAASLIAPSLDWSSVAAQYRLLAVGLLGARAA